MDKNLQKILLATLKKSGGRLSKDELHRDPVVLSYFSEATDQYPAPQQADEILKIDEKIDHNISLLEDEGKLKIGQEVFGVMGMSRERYEVTSKGYSELNENIMEDNFEGMTEEELDAIVRKNENAYVPTSRFNRAKNELEIRHRKNMEKMAERNSGAVHIVAKEVHNSGVIGGVVNDSNSKAEPQKESFLSKFFWQIIVAFIVAVAAIIIATLISQHHFFGIQ